MTNKYQLLASLVNIEKEYDTYFIDVSGVIYDGKKPFTHAIATINKLLQQKKQIVFLSNNPRPGLFTERIIKTSGIIGNYRIVTSGDLFHHTLATTLFEKKIYHLGRNRQHALLEGTNAQLTNSPFDADAIILSCFVQGDEDHTLFNKDLEHIIASGKPVYCPNPDQLALEGSILRYPSGYFAHKITEQGGSVIYLGKPSRIIYDFIMQVYPDISFNRDTTLMIGDTLETDICGARHFGIDSLLVLSGISGLLSKNNPDLFIQSPHQPTYIMEKLL